MGADDAILVIANPTSGKGRGRRLAEALVSSLRHRGASVNVALTREAGDAGRLAREGLESADERPTCIVACGGDGTIQQVAHEMAVYRAERGDACPHLALAPGGRCNDFARALGVPHDAAELARVIAQGRARSIDLATVNGRHFCTVATVGIDADISRYVDGMRMPLTGTAAYLYGALCVLLRYAPRPLMIEGDFGPIDEPIFLASTANTHSYGGAVPIAPGADPTDGLLDLCVISYSSTFRALQLVPAILRGKHTKRDGVLFRRIKRLTIKGADPTELWADGEHIADTPAEIEVVPNAIEVRLP